MVEKLNGKGCNGIDDDGDSVIDTDFTFNGEPVYSSNANYLVDGKSMNIFVYLKFVDDPSFALKNVSRQQNVVKM